MQNLILPSGFRFAFSLLSVVLLWCHSQPYAAAQLPTASLRTIWPNSVQSGTSSVVTVEGDFLDEAETLVLSDARVTAVLNTGEPLPGTTEPTKHYGQFTLNVPAEVPSGFLDVRVQGRYGLSNPRRLAIESNPVSIIDAAGFSPEQAKEPDISNVWIARTSANQIDHYKMQLAGGSSLRITCDALSIDSLLVPALILCDDQQRELVRARGTKSADATLSFSVETAGTYYLKVHDALFRGGTTFFYRLRLHTESTQHPGAMLGAQETLGAQATKQASDATSHQRIAEFSEENLDQFLTSSANVRRLDPAELSDSFNISLTPPERVLSSFPRTGIPVASFDFDAKAGERWVIKVASATTGAATDPEMQIGRLHPMGEAGFRFERLHHIDDVATLPGSLLGSTEKDPYHLFQVPENGRYRVILRDLQTTSGESWDRKFLLSICPPEPNFELRTLIPHTTLDPARSAPMGTQLRRGDRLAVEVAIIPHEGFFQPIIAEASVAGGDLKLRTPIAWSWPVVVTAEDLPAGLTGSTLKLDNSNRRGHLILEAADDLGPWTGPLRITGKIEIPAELGGQVLIREAKPITIQLSDPDGRGHAVVRPCSNLQLSTTESESTPIKVSLGGESREFTVKVGTDLEIPLSIMRTDAAKGKVTLRAIGLPPNSNAGEVNLEGENLTANMKLSAPANVPLGDYQIFVNAETEVSWPRNPQALARAESRLEALKQILATGEDSSKEAISKQITEAEAQVNQLRESTKPQPARVFLPSNPIIVHVVAAQ